MKTSSASVALVAALSSVSNALIFNKTAAYAPGQYEKYKCITTEGVNDMFPDCLKQCQRDANAADGCAYNDFACHCANYDVYSPLIETCAFPPALGGTGTCSFAELGQARVVVTDLCNFFNATLYTASAECQQSDCKEEQQWGHHGGNGHGWGGWGGWNGWKKYGQGRQQQQQKKANNYDLRPKKTFNLIAGQEITILDE